MGYMYELHPVVLLGLDFAEVENEDLIAFQAMLADAQTHQDEGKWYVDADWLAVRFRSHATDIIDAKESILAGAGEHET